MFEEEHPRCWYFEIWSKKHFKGNEGSIWQEGEKYPTLLLRKWKNNNGIIYRQKQDKKKEHFNTYNYAW